MLIRWAIFACAALVLPTKPATSAERSWNQFKNLPFQIESGIEIASRQARSGSASLSLLCAKDGKIHLLLQTRLPGPRLFKAKERDDVVLLLVNGTEREIPLVVDILEKGGDVAWLPWLLGMEDAASQDTILSNPLEADKLIELEGWFGSSPPAKVSIVGILETGVFMAGTLNGASLQNFRTSCRSQN